MDPQKENPVKTIDLSIKVRVRAQVAEDNDLNEALIRAALLAAVERIANPAREDLGITKILSVGPVVG